MRASLPHLPNLLGGKAAPEALLRQSSAARLPLQSRLEVSSVPYPLYLKGTLAKCQRYSVWLVM